MERDRDIRELLLLLDCEPDAERRWQMVNVLRELLNPPNAVKERRRYGYAELDRRRPDTAA